MKNKIPKHISEIIKNYFEDRNWEQRIDGSSIFDSWEEIIPVKISLNTKPEKIQNNKLFIKVKNHVWANELKIKKGEIINLVNKNMGYNLINDLIIKIDSKYFKNNQ